MSRGGSIVRPRDIGRHPDEAFLGQGARTDLFCLLRTGMAVPA